MIAQLDDPYGADVAAVEAALMQEPLASAAEHTITSFTAVSETLTQVGELAIDYGLGKPLTAFQALLATYQALAGVQATLAANASIILSAAEQMAAEA